MICLWSRQRLQLSSPLGRPFFSSISSIDISLPAAEEDAIVNDFRCLSGVFGLRDGSPALRVEAGAIFGDGVRERDDEVREWLRSGLNAFAR